MLPQPLASRAKSTEQSLNQDDVELTRSPSHQLASRRSEPHGVGAQFFANDTKSSHDIALGSTNAQDPIMSRSPLIRSSEDQPGPYESLSTTEHGQDARTGSVDLTASTGDLSATSRSRWSRRKSLAEHEEAFTSGMEIPAGHSKLPQGFAAVVEGGSSDEGDTDGLEGSSKWSVEDPPDNSIYPQVRASVSATDDYTLSISTPRMWVLSIVFALLGSSTNLFFSLRYPSVSITPVIALIMVHPLGLAWDSMFKHESDPEVIFENGVKVPSEHMPSGTISRWTRVRLWLAQGHWNEKEHACVYISSNVAFGFAFATDVIVEQKMFYKQNTPVLYQLLLTISTQILGYAFAGLTRRYLVHPPSMIWPGTLMSTAMFTTMHKSENKPANGWRVTRWRFFVYVWIGTFAWYFVPGLLMPALSYFNVLTWFAPNSVVVANLFGVSSGLGLFPITFDWAQIAYIGSPLLTPWWAAANVVAGLAVIMWIVAPICYYTNALYSAFMPILSSSVFDNTGKIYDVSKILTDDFIFDEDAFQKYSPIYLPITYVLSYGVQFASLTALVTHTICWHGKDIVQQTKESFKERNEGKGDYQPLAGSGDAPNGNTRPNSSHTSSTDPTFEASMAGEDVHNRLMKRYEDAPISWYLAMFIAMLAIGIFVVEYYPVHLPYYGLLLALAITTIMFLPVAIVMAITNQHSSLYLIAQLVCGYIFPGRPVANMVFTTYAYISSAQGIKFSSDLKLGHYMKIPPRTLFTVQLVATLISSFAQIGVLNWMFAQVPGICTPQALNGFNCPIARVHFNGSILWGVVGPQRFFGSDALYCNLIWFFLLGAVAPPVVWYVARNRRKGILRKINFPLLFGSISWIPPAVSSIRSLPRPALQYIISI